MDYYKIFNPNNEESDVYCIQSFFNKYPYFNSKEYKIFNMKIDSSLDSLNGIYILAHYHIYGSKKNYITSIKHFYMLYPSFDIIFYKFFYKKKNKNHLNDIYYLVDYYCDQYMNNNQMNNKITSFNDFKEKYSIDYNFLKIFYTEFTNKDEYDIAILLIESLDESFILKKYILSDLDFIKRYPTFNLNLYKLLNSEKLPLYSNDIEYKSYWYHIGQYKNETISIEGIVNTNIHGLNLELYRSIYNINQNELDEEMIYNIYKNRDSIIYSYESFLKIIDDFNYILFIKHYPLIKNYSKDKIIEFYINNINKINNIYSDKMFYIKYPDFNIDEYRLFNNDKNESIKIYNEYNISNNKDSIIISIKHFYKKYPDFDLEYCKKILIKKNIMYSADNEYIYYWYNNQNITNPEYFMIEFKKDYPDFNMMIYKFFKSSISLDSIYTNEYKNEYTNTYTNEDDYSILLDFININDKSNLIYSVDTFYKINSTFDKDIYYLFNHCDTDDIDNKDDTDNKDTNKCYNDENIICDYFKLKIKNNLESTTTSTSTSTPLKLIYNISTFLENYSDFNIKLYRVLNKDLSIMNDKELIIHWYTYGKNQNRIYSIETFYKIYPFLNFDINSKSYNFIFFNELLNNQYVGEQSDEVDKIIYWMENGVYNYLKRKNKNIVGRDIVNNIYEVLIDLEQNKPLLEKGISLIIRAKNEELNLKYCIETVVDLVDEIIFVDNNSNDNTYKIMEKYASEYNNIKIYQYNINVSKVGIEHENALKTNNMNTLGTFYNWCLSKATRYNVFKWDADFICIRNNFKQLVDLYNLRYRDDKFAIWFTGKTLFEDIDKYYLNERSFYNEYRIFSYKNGFKWYNGNTCEYTEPYIVNCEKRYKYIHPLFYEIKRTSIDEFMERSSMIDKRDINDFNILNNLKNKSKEKENHIEGLIYIDKNIINIEKRIIIITPSLNFGGGNQFVLYMYNKLKIFGFTVKIVPLQKILQKTFKNNNNSVLKQSSSNKFNSIVETDIENIEIINLDYIKTFSPNYIIFNSNISFEEGDIEKISKITKIIFVTHSDVAFSNYFIEKYNKFIYKIVTVNIYTIKKLTVLLKINLTSFFKLINIFDDLHEDEDIINDELINDELKKNNISKSLIIKTKKFGVISRFSDDKNIPMFIYSLLEVFKKYPDYKCYLVGTDNIYYDNYLKYLCELLDISKYISFEGYQDNVLKYYKMFDFIVLPSVSEGCAYNIIEGMSLGKPMIVSDVGGNHELIKNNVNGIIYPYTGIKEFESKTVYIKNYNEQLSLIGYFKKSEIDKNYLNNNINYNNIEVNIPYFVSCKLCKNITYQSNRCIYCLNIKRKIEIFNKNMLTISSSIIKMIEIDDLSRVKIYNNNKEFIKRNFNNNIYIHQILELIR